MPRYRLRTLLILLAVGPMVLAWVWWLRGSIDGNLVGLLEMVVVLCLAYWSLSQPRRPLKSN